MALTLGAVEAVLRWWVPPSRIYSTIRSVPEYNQWKNEVRYWERYQGRRNALGIGHDPLLGWDVDIQGDRMRGDAPASRAPGVQRTVALGDSFTYGNEVGESENFAALLDARPELQVLNMAVPGYGIDQAYLKYREHGAIWEPDVVLFGIYVDDYERASVGFTSSAKPRMVLTDTGLEIRGQPVPTPEAELARIGRALDARPSVLVDAVTNLWRKANAGAAQEKAFFDTMDRVVSHILTALRDGLKPSQRLLILHIPRAEHFVDPDGFRTRMGQRLIAIYQSLDIPHIDLAVEFSSRSSPGYAYQHYYVHQENGSVGHLSPEGHRQVAILISAWH